MLFNLLTTWEIRLELISAMKEGRRIGIELGAELLPVDVRKVGLATVTYDLYDVDETTWLATHTLSILDIDGINHAHVERARNQLIGLEDEGYFQRERAAFAAGEVELYLEDDEAEEG